MITTYLIDGHPVALDGDDVELARLYLQDLPRLDVIKLLRANGFSLGDAIHLVNCATGPCKEQAPAT